VKCWNPELANSTPPIDVVGHYFDYWKEKPRSTCLQAPVSAPISNSAPITRNISRENQLHIIFYIAYVLRLL
jgi:hypothetical protein